jgi:hypothetical protein
MNLLTELIDRSLLVEDRALLAADRAAEGPATVTVINTSGAGGLVALAGRTPAHVRLVAVDNAVRDTVDPVGNIARIAAAARELDPDIAVRVAIPRDCSGYDDAVSAVEAEGLQGLLGDHRTPEQAAAELSAFVEADLPFAATVSTAGQLASLLVALDQLIDGASVEQATQTLTAAADEQLRAINGWDDQRAARIRRRLTAVRSLELPALLEELEELDVI